MTKFPLIARWLPELKSYHIEVSSRGTGLPVTQIMPSSEGEWVKKSELNAALSKGVELFGLHREIGHNNVLRTEKYGDSTHSGLLLGYSKIPETKRVTMSEIENFLLDVDRGKLTNEKASNLLQRIKAHGVTNE